MQLCFGMKLNPVWGINMDAYDELIAALGYYFGDGEIPASEESIREIIGQEHDPIQTIAEALDEYRERVK